MIPIIPHEMALLDLAERWVRGIGGLTLLATLAVIFYGLWRGLRRPVGRTAGRPPELLRKPAFYIFAGLGYFGLCSWLWRPITLALSPPAQIVALIVGTLLFFPGLGLVLWGRLALGRLYFVSSSLGAQLYAGHRLVTHGPYALLRHPMYLGILLVGLGGILIYHTWTMVFVALNFLGLLVRAWREEQVLAAEFGAQWDEYCRRVPRWIPRFRRKG